MTILFGQTEPRRNLKEIDDALEEAARTVERHKLGPRLPMLIRALKLSQPTALERYAHIYEYANVYGFLQKPEYIKIPMTKEIHTQWKTVSAAHELFWGQSCNHELFLILSDCGAYPCIVKTTKRRMGLPEDVKSYVEEVSVGNPMYAGSFGHSWLTLGELSQWWDENSQVKWNAHTAEFFYNLRRMIKRYDNAFDVSHRVVFGFDK